MNTEQKNELNDEYSWSLRPRHPDHSSVWKNPRDIGQPFNAQRVQPLREITADEVQGGIDKTREVISRAREDIQPLSEKANVILSHIPSN
jgi:hypothetical protein